MSYSIETIRAPQDNGRRDAPVCTVGLVQYLAFQRGTARCRVEASMDHGMMKQRHWQTEKMNRLPLLMETSIPRMCYKKVASVCNTKPPTPEEPCHGGGLFEDKYIADRSEKKACVSQCVRPGCATGANRSRRIGTVIKTDHEISPRRKHRQDVRDGICNMFRLEFDSDSQGTGS